MRLQQKRVYSWKWYPTTDHLSRCVLTVLLGVLFSTVQPVHAAVFHWAGTDSTTEIRSTVLRRNLFVDVAEACIKLPISVEFDTTALMAVLCTSANCRPVYLEDEDEAAIVDHRISVRAEVIAEALGCTGEVRKKQTVVMDCGGKTWTKVGSAEGEHAPGFTLPMAKDTMGTVVSVSMTELLIKGAVAVLFFRSAEWDPFSQALLAEAQAKLDSLNAAGVQVVGIHGYEAWVSRKWAPRFGITFPLLADHLSAVARGYKVFERGNLPRPALFLIDPTGVIRLRHEFDSTVMPDLGILMRAIGNDER